MVLYLAQRLLGGPGGLSLISHLPKRHGVHYCIKAEDHEPCFQAVTKDSEDSRSSSFVLLLTFIIPPYIRSRQKGPTRGGTWTEPRMSIESR